MCTIHTYSVKFYKQHRELIEKQVLLDSIGNDDGISVVFLDGHNDRSNTIYRSMDAKMGIRVVQELMSEATKHGRVFIHLRAATTLKVGVGYTHGFDDMNGVVYMHNGVFSNPKSYSVDSFQITNWSGTAGAGLLSQLIARKETFANIIRIDTEKYLYSVTRMDASSLFTDGEGNYSSREFGTVNKPVAKRSTQSFVLSALEKPRYIHAGYSSSIYNDGYKPGNRWDMDTNSWIPLEEWERKRDLKYPGTSPYKPVIPVTVEPSRNIIMGPPESADKVVSGDDESLPEAVDSVVKRITQSSLLDEGDLYEDDIDTEMYNEWLKHNTRGNRGA